MKRLITVLNIAIASYFFILANIYFWGSILVLLFWIFRQQEPPKNLLNLLTLLIFAPFLIIASIFFLRKSKDKYILGLVLLSIILVEDQIYRFFLVTRGKLETTDLTNLIFYGIPLVIIYFTKRLDKKYTLEKEPPSPN